MRSFRLKYLSVLLLFTCLLSACLPAAAAPTVIPVPPTETPLPTSIPSPTAPPTLQPTPDVLSMQDGLGRTVTLTHPAVRIISLAPSNTEILFAIHAGGQIVGRDSFSDYPKEAQIIQDIGGPSFGSTWS